MFKLEEIEKIANGGLSSTNLQNYNLSRYLVLLCKTLKLICKQPKMLLGERGIKSPDEILLEESKKLKFFKQDP